METQYVGFDLANNKYCLNIMEVKEVVRELKITKVPDAPYYVEGIMNLRGVIIPIISLKKKLKIKEPDNINTKSNTVLFTDDKNKATNKNVEIKSSNKRIDSKLLIVQIDDVLVGFIVDNLDRVFAADSSSIQSPEKINETTIDKSLIEGLIKFEEQVYLLINVKKIVGEAEKEFIQREVIE